MLMFICPCDNFDKKGKKKEKNKKEKKEEREEKGYFSIFKWEPIFFSASRYELLKLIYYRMYTVRTLLERTLYITVALKFP